MPKKRRVGKSVIVQVRKSKRSRQKTVTIPKKARHIRAGDFIILRRVSRL